jgi:hypothetical protein
MAQSSSVANAVLVGRHDVADAQDFPAAFVKLLARFGFEMIPIESEPNAGKLYFNSDILCVRYGDDTGELLYVQLADGSKTFVPRDECGHLINRSKIRLVGADTKRRAVAVLGSAVTAVMLIDKDLFKPPDG